MSTICIKELYGKIIQIYYKSMNKSSFKNCPQNVYWGG